MTKTSALYDDETNKLVILKIFLRIYGDKKNTDLDKLASGVDLSKDNELPSINNKRVLVGAEANLIDSNSLHRSMLIATSQELKQIMNFILINLALNCFFFLLCLTYAFYALNVKSNHSKDKALREQSVIESFPFYILCAAGGILSSLGSDILIPIDVIKLRIQAGHYTGFSDGVSNIFSDVREELRPSFTNFRTSYESHIFNFSFSTPCNDSHVHWGVTTFLKQIFAMTMLTVRLILIFFTHFFNSLLVLFCNFFCAWQAVFVANAVHGFLKYGIFEFAKRVFVESDNSAEFDYIVVFFAAVVAEIVAAVVFTPFEVIKAKLQIYFCKYDLSLSVPLILYCEGLSGLYSALIPVMCRQVPLTALKFVLFERVAIWLYSIGIGNYTNKVGIALLAGFIAGAIAAVVTHPADSLVTSIVIEESESWKKKNKVVFFYNFLKSGIFKGFFPRVLMLSLVTALQWGIYDGFKYIVGLPTSGIGATEFTNPD